MNKKLIQMNDDCIYVSGRKITEDDIERNVQIFAGLAIDDFMKHKGHCYKLESIDKSRKYKDTDLFIQFQTFDADMATTEDIMNDEFADVDILSPYQIKSRHVNAMSEDTFRIIRIRDSSSEKSQSKKRKTKKKLVFK